MHTATLLQQVQCVNGLSTVEAYLVFRIGRIRKAAGKGFRGIKLYPSSWKTMHVWDERCYPIYKEAMRHKMLVFCHFGITIGGEADLRHGNPIDIQIPARDFPELNFVIAHFGAGWFRETLLMQ